ncbi:MAG TPA: hypothetical protein VGD91_25840 [Trebonia sp.]
MVAALSGLAALWIIVNPLTGNHANATNRWLQSVTLLLVSAACTTLVVWLIQYLVIKPHDISDRKFELGYQAGRADALTEMRPSLSAVASLSDRRGRTGT